MRRMLEHLGAFGLDADGLAHRAMSPGAPAYQPIVDNFGRWILDAQGRIDREKLGNIAFSDPEALARLEKITHPIVIQVIDLLIKRAKQDLVALEAIKLFESGLAGHCDSVWVIDAPSDVQLKRLMQARKLSQPAAQMRIDAQPAQADKLAQASVIIYNGAGYENTYEQVEKHLQELLRIAEPVAEPEREVVAAAPPGEVEVAVQRGGPKQAEAIASFINQVQGTKLSRADIILRFGQKAYMLAYDNDKMIGLVGCQVENLIARVDEFIVAPAAPVDRTVRSLIVSTESAANALQAEVSLLFLSNDVSDQIRQAVLDVGYEVLTPADLRIPDWREAAEESAPPDSFLTAKRLRKDRVLKPL